MSFPTITVKYIVFTGTTITPAELEFDNGCNLVWGASNTGKSFALKTINFMLGGSKALPDIEQRHGYETIWLGLTLSGTGDFTLSRSITGGGYELYTGLIRASSPEKSRSLLDPIHNHEKPSNLSSFLLNHLGFERKFVATNTYGQQRSLSFRDLVHILLVNETAIQADDRSPVETGQRGSIFLERSVFRLLLSGSDDCGVISVENPKKMRQFKTTRLELLDELLADVDSRLSEYPNIKEASIQDANLTENLEAIQAEFKAAQGSIRLLLEEKKVLASEIPLVGERLDEIEVHLGRFAQLEKVYKSDIERLEALEEASFLVSLGSGRDCPLCGAGPDAQLHLQSNDDVEQLRVSSIAEIRKIEMMRTDLKTTVMDLGVERERLRQKIPGLQEMLVKVEGDIAATLPKFEEQRRMLSEVLAIRDRIKASLALIKQKDSLLTKRIETEKTKPISKKAKPKLILSGTLAHEFCGVVSEVLTKWEFPGRREVSFDEKTFDIRIDGKLRTDNGKGVRAITHAAFKVALLIFCHDRGLPHPGFIVLDTPLLTYRDPLKNPKYGSLEDDEMALAQTSLKQKFFEHLFSIRNLGQFIIFENVDLPENITDLAKVTIFHGRPGGRVGLFPPNISKGLEVGRRLIIE